MASRAHLLAGLRTGGPRSSSPFEGDRFEQEQSSPCATNASPAANTVTLKANAAPFTPNKRLSATAAKGVEGQAAAALRMQQAIVAATSQRQASYSTGEDFAAMYGASQGQPQQADFNQQDMANLIRQKQAQLLQNQMLAQQQQQQQQQMEMYRLQAASQQQQHLQQVATQQRLLLAQMQAEYNQQQQYSAQDQRMSAQASLQASMRQRQAEQMYAQLMAQQQQQGHQNEDAQVQQQQQLLQRLQLLQMQAAAMQGMQDLSFGEDSPQAMSTPIRRNGSNGSPRADSPSVGQQNRRDRQASQTAADNATSWRSTPTSLSKASKVNAGKSAPSIVVDDSASDKSDDAGNSICEDNETPETSEEDISAGVLALAKEVSQRLSVEKREPSISPRPLSLSQAPRTRAFSTEVKTSVPAGSGVNVASRQPKGPPTEFLSINFTSRLSARTRREAMSKLCASPRAATFNIVPRAAVVA